MRVSGPRLTRVQILSSARQAAWYTAAMPVGMPRGHEGKSYIRCLGTCTLTQVLWHPACPRVHACQQGRLNPVSLSHLLLVEG